MNLEQQQQRPSLLSPFNNDDDNNNAMSPYLFSSSKSLARDLERLSLSAEASSSSLQYNYLQQSQQDLLRKHVGMPVLDHDDQEETQPPPLVDTFQGHLTGRPLADFYDVGKVLGEGGYAIVYQATSKETGITYAMKDIDRSKASNDGDYDDFREEIRVLQLLCGASPHIVALYEVFLESTSVYLIMEECKGGELLDKICEKECYPEREARKLCRILFEAVNTLHDLRIAHRDLKPENLLLLHPPDKRDDITIKMIDFGLAKRVTSPKCLKSLVGSPEYVAPEILDLDEGYDHRVDLWSCGVVMYIVLGGYAPFEGPHMNCAIVEGAYAFHDKYWKDISDNAKNMLRNLLQVDPDKRWSAKQVLECEWLKEIEEEEETAENHSPSLPTVITSVVQQSNGQDEQEFDEGGSYDGSDISSENDDRDDESSYQEEEESEDGSEEEEEEDEESSVDEEEAAVYDDEASALANDDDDSITDDFVPNSRSIQETLTSMKLDPWQCQVCDFYNYNVESCSLCCYPRKNQQGNNNAPPALSIVQNKHNNNKNNQTSATNKPLLLKKPPPPALKTDDDDDEYDLQPPAVEEQPLLFQTLRQSNVA